MNRRHLAVGIALALLAAGVGTYLWHARAEEARLADAAAARDAREARRLRREDERWRTIREESRELIPPSLPGLHLGMPLAEARSARPGMERNAGAANPDEPDLLFMEERLRNGARVVYGFENESRRLQRLQVLSMLPSVDAVGPHLMAMNEQYGAPTGIWDCPNTGGVPTRRFTWRHGQTAVSDIFLVYGGRVSVTLYVAPTATIQRSLRIAACQPVRNRQEAAAFPVTSPEQMMASQPQGPGSASAP